MALVERAPILTGLRLPSERVAEIQRQKILTGAVYALDELGWDGATVTEIISRARVSRTCFYALFKDRDACVAAILETAARAVTAELVIRGVVALPWRERVRSGMTTILEFLDREPALARVCVLVSLRGGRAVLEQRAAILAAAAAELDRGRERRACAAHCTPLTAEGLVGGALSILHARLLADSGEPLAALGGELGDMLLLPYPGGRAAAARGGRGPRRTAATVLAPTPGSWPEHRLAARARASSASLGA